MANIYPLLGLRENLKKENERKWEDFEVSSWLNVERKYRRKGEKKRWGLQKNIFSNYGEKTGGKERFYSKN